MSLARRYSSDGDPIPLDGGGFYWGGVEIQNSPWLQFHLTKCKEFTDIQADWTLLGVYHCLTSIWHHSKLMLERTVEEAFVVAYNPLILLTTMANHHLDLVTHTVLQRERGKSELG